MPSWYAFAALEAARDATEDLLWPIDRGRWLRLALIALFVGVGGGAPTGGGNANIPSGGGGGGASPDMAAPSIPDGSAVAIFAAVVALVLALILLWSLVGAVMEFVLVVSLRDREVSIRDPFREQFRPGLRLFGFRLAVGLLGLLVIAVPLLAVFAAGFGLVPAAFALILPLIAVFALVAFVSSVFLGLTTDFVVPAMLTENLGVLDGWRRLWPTLRAEWKQVGLYLVAKFVLSLAVSLAVSIVVLLVALVLAIPFALVGGLLFLGASAAGVHGAVWVILLLFGALFVLAMVVVGLVVQVPALTFVRYYSLSVLGMLVPELDLVGVDRPDDSEDDDNGDDDGDDDDGGDDTPASALDDSTFTLTDDSTETTTGSVPS